jgi:hypothetical protein
MPSAMAGNFKDPLGDTINRISMSEEIQNTAKLGPGVVGRNSRIILSFLVVAGAGIGAGATMHSPLIVGISLGCGFIGTLTTVILNVHFGQKNPGAAILEGSEFIQYQQIMASKGNPVIIPVLPIEAKPKELASGDGEEGGK